MFAVPRRELKGFSRVGFEAIENAGAFAGGYKFKL